MNLFSELIAAVQSDQNIGSESTLYPLTTVKLALNRAKNKAYGLVKWPELKDAKKTSTIAAHEYYDYPQDWQSDSIWRIEIDGVQWGDYPDGSPMSYDDYLVWRSNTNNANSTDKKWANQNRRYFIYPVPTTNGSLNLSVWGYRVGDDLSADGDVTIFSYSMPEGNEAIVLEAVAILKSKAENEKSGEFRSLEAKQILLTSWKKIKAEQAKYEKDQPMFNVPDLFASSARSVKTNYGDF